MKNIILLICLTIFTSTVANAQSKKHSSAPAYAAGEYWQSSSDEGLVKCGRGYFLNKMVIKTNYDTPDDLMDVNETTVSENTDTKNATVKVTPAKTEIVVASNTIATTK